jgi:hypothetical protein
MLCLLGLRREELSRVTVGNVRNLRSGSSGRAATIQRLMALSSISITKVYLHISNELKAEAVEKLIA